MAEIVLLDCPAGVPEKVALTILGRIQGRFGVEAVQRVRLNEATPDVVDGVTVTVALLGTATCDDRPIQALGQIVGPRKPLIPVLLSDTEDSAACDAFPYPDPILWTPKSAPAAERRLLERIADRLLYSAEPQRPTGAGAMAVRVAEESVRVGRLPWRRAARAGTAIALAVYATLMLLTPHPYVWIAPGVFEMGCPGATHECDVDESPVHRVALTQGFWMSRTEITVAQYAKFAKDAGLPMPPAPSFDVGWRSSARPIVNVTWEEADAYCRWDGGRLPTEAEWEYAARGGVPGRIYPWGHRLVRTRANYLGQGAGDPYEQTAPAASFPPNGFGLYDMAGNAWEWTADYYAPDTYAKSACVDPTGPEDGQARVVRGGGWAYSPSNLRLSARNAFPPDTRSVAFGFRCVRDD